MYFKYLAFLILDLLAGVVNLVLAWPVAACAGVDGWLPKWLWWFQTPGDSLNGSIGWQTKDRWFLTQDIWYKRWVNRVGWLYRNPMYGFAIEVLGAQALTGDTLTVMGDSETGNHSPLHPGWVRYVLVRNGRPVYFQFYLVWPWCSTRYLRLNLGWKLWSMPTLDKMQFTFSPNPFRKI